MKTLFDLVSGGRIWPLFLKEFHQIKRNKRLVVILVLPPTLNIVLFGFALNPQVSNLLLGVVDQSRTADSRELVSAFEESRSFRIATYYASADELGRALSAGELSAGLIIPYDFAKRREREQTAEVQLLIDAVDSNTAAIASGYAGRIIEAFNQRVAQRAAARVVQSPARANAATAPRPIGSGSQIVSLSQTRVANTDTAAPDMLPSANPPANSGEQSFVLGGRPIDRSNITARVSLLYNPGLKNSWFIATGLIGSLLVIQGSLVAAASMVKEKEMGTVEQLLMTPAGAGEIIVAKIAPIFLLLTGDIGLALFVMNLVFGVPVNGSLLLLFITGSLCVLTGIGIGTLIATFTRSQQQAQLMGFFVNPPIVMLSGATTPVEAMPHWLQPVTYLNPVRHFTIISRGIMLKGTGLTVLYPHVLALIAFAALLVGVSAWRFRKQLG